MERHSGVALWLLLAAPALAGALLLHGREALVSAAGVPLLGVAVAVRERWPLVALAVPVALGLALDVELLAAPYWPALAALAWLAGSRAGARPALWFHAAVAVAGLPLCLVLSPDHLWGWPSLLLVLLIVVVLPWQLGRYRRRYAALARAGWRLADRMEREQRIVADRARIRERARIAGDMHDSLGHDLTLMAMRAAALQLDPALDPRHQAVVAELREAAAEATERLRDIVGVLRTGDDEAQVEQPFTSPEQPFTSPEQPFAPGEQPFAPGEQPFAPGEQPFAPGEQPFAPGEQPFAPGEQPFAPAERLGDVNAPHSLSEGARAAGDPLPPGERRDAADGPLRLVERARAAGMAVTPERLDDLTGIPPMTVLAVGRVVQEGLTNAAKHAPRAPVRVRVIREDGTLRVSVANAAPVAPAVDAVSGGAGLAGLDERVRLAGGVLRAGPVRGGGFEVVAELPTQANAAARPLTGADLSTSARELARAEREVRRGLAQTVLLPLAVLTGILALMIPVWSVSTSLSVLPRGTYDGLAVGAPRGEVEARLPAFTRDGPPDGAPPAPDGQSCVYYTVRAFDDGAYRLCFAGDRLTSKSMVGHRK
ncbi:sensor histidine kinase [Nonomuraea montanisoli]|uniref:sensor histidine kinase n=1 Tax=Nonomuraea montanisoli TaxID=2741721 RepID=UPI001964CB29|nr:histidine kinase [Nonomuraea montanisoli]